MITGKVILAGAGPGDPELISVKAAKALQQADVVLTDRLVSPRILEEYVPLTATIIPVGKEGRKNLSTPQKTINRLLVEYASQGKTVVRLKGGDVSVFSNILDELQVLVEHQIHYEIIPGIPAALGAAAYAGIPLTASHYSTGVRILQFNGSEPLEPFYWIELANSNDTLVFYLTTHFINKVLAELLIAGITADKYIAVVEQATTKNQNVYVSPVHKALSEFSHLELKNPSLLIIGKVVALYEQFAWLKNSGSKENYFRLSYPLDSARDEEPLHTETQ